MSNLNEGQNMNEIPIPIGKGNKEPSDISNRKQTEKSCATVEIKKKISTALFVGSATPNRPNQPKADDMVIPIGKTRARNDIQDMFLITNGTGQINLNVTGKQKHETIKNVEHHLTKSTVITEFEHEDFEDLEVERGRTHNRGDLRDLQGAGARSMDTQYGIPCKNEQQTRIYDNDKVFEGNDMNINVDNKKQPRAQRSAGNHGIIHFAHKIYMCTPTMGKRKGVRSENSHKISLADEIREIERRTSFIEKMKVGDAWIPKRQIPLHSSNPEGHGGHTQYEITDYSRQDMDRTENNELQKKKNSHSKAIDNLRKSKSQTSVN
ncbi:uncharacterized protein [Ambystoma mexicanum]|uniref:uncharacterized protein n=1 Tax=Ambystoma mexicanum TaxID=8296 RepID=UPI0037E7B808